MLHPFSKLSTDVAGLGGVRRCHEFNLEPDCFGLVLDKVLKLAEGPAMQPCPHPQSGLDVGPDVGEILHAEESASACGGVVKSLKDPVRFISLIFRHSEWLSSIHSSPP
jgi:hypothetical protein